MSLYRNPLETPIASTANELASWMSPTGFGEPGADVTSEAEALVRSFSCSYHCRSFYRVHSCDGGSEPVTAETSSANYLLRRPTDKTHHHSHWLSLEALCSFGTACSPPGSGSP